MKNLLTFNYWFNLQPEKLVPFAEHIFIGLIIVLALATIIIALIKNRSGIYHGFLNHLYSFYLTNTLIGLLLFAINYETILFFSARFWFALWALSILIWLFFIFKRFKKIPIIKKQLKEEQERKKYLP